VAGKGNCVYRLINIYVFVEIIISAGVPVRNFVSSFRR
jgi:hypothetical protein